MSLFNELMNLVVELYCLTYAKNGREANKELHQLLSRFDNKKSILKDNCHHSPLINEEFEKRSLIRIIKITLLCF
jgi:hypothetical protein